VRRETRNGVEILRARGTTFDKSRFAGRVANYLSYFFSAWVAGAAPRVPTWWWPSPISDHRPRRPVRRATGRRALRLCLPGPLPEVTRLMENFRSRLMDAALERVGRALVARADRSWPWARPCATASWKARAPIPPA